MMNVLTDILCDTSSIMAPQGFKETLPQDEMSHHDISSKQRQLHLLDSVSQISGIDRPLSVINHSSPSNINIFNASSQIHIPSNIDSTYGERNNVSAFSDSFPEMVPSWLAHDFMKVSDTLPSPGILSNVSDIYSTNRDSEHLEMLDIEFPHEITSPSVSNNLNRSCINENQKLLVELPVRQFSNGDSLIIPSFTNLSNTHLQLSMNKNMSYQKFNKNGSNVESARSLMNTVLPCGNELLQIPLPSNLTEQCLNSSSSPSVMSNSQSQSHQVDVVCDKLPQINLNHLDSLLGNEAPLSDIHLLRHDFSTVPLGENGCNSHSNRICLDSYNPNGNLISCAGNTLASHIPPLPNLQDASVQVSISSLSENITSVKENCYSCREIGPQLPIEVIQCFKCRFCDFISIHKCEVASHINALHSKTSSTSICKSSLINIRSDNYNPVSVEDQSQAHYSTTDSITSTTVTPITNANVNNIISERNTVENQKYPCMQCTSTFSNINDYNMHLFNHNNKSDQFQLNLAQTKVDGYQLLPINYVVVNTSSKNNVVNNIPKLLQSDPKNSKRKILQKKTDEMPKKNHSKSSNSKPTETYVEKTISSHKKAWQKKMKRELGSYICEFKGCNIRFRALDNLEFHRKCHLSHKSAFICPECETKFDNWAALAGHLWRNHGNDMELHACDQCPYRTYGLSRLENYHKRIHRDECLFLCDTCGKSFKNGKQLRNHRVRHSKDSPRKKLTLKCNICFKPVSSKMQLLQHHRTVHNKIKPYMCKFCDYSASKRSTLNMHTRQHTGEKPFVCDKCEFRTADHNSLRRHKMTHSGEKPYKCPHCTYSCIQAERFKIHLKTHKDFSNEGLMFSCNICSFGTLKQDNYISHMAEHEIQNRPQGENSMAEIHSTDEIFPLAEAMDKSLSSGDHLLSNFNKNKYMQSYYNGLNTNNGLNMVSNGLISANGWIVSG